jgi:hypothetical protein
MSVVHLTCAFCGRQFIRNKHGLHYGQNKYYCSQDCLADERHLEKTMHPHSIITPNSKVEERVDELMLVCAKKTATMVDRHGNLRSGYTEQDWNKWSDLHDQLCDVAEMITSNKRTER